MKKVKMNTAKLQFHKEKITNLTGTYGGTPKPPVTVTVCVDKCASMGCTIVFCVDPSTPAAGCVPPVLTGNSYAGCQLTLNPPGITTC